MSGGGSVVEVTDETFQSEVLEQSFQRRFGAELPETLNAGHGLLLSASELDESSKRIVEYLAKTHGVNINTAFFNFFVDGDRDCTGLLDVLTVDELELLAPEPWDEPRGEASDGDRRREDQERKDRAQPDAPHGVATILSLSQSVQLDRTVTRMRQGRCSRPTQRSFAPSTSPGATSSA